MIFLTVGTQLAFPRLTEAMNRYAETTDETIIAQVGAETTPLPNLQVRRMIKPPEFDEIFSNARVVVAHAGVGTILSAKRFGRPLIVVPRRHELGEHRNDHQMATANALMGTPGIHVAWEVDDALSMLRDADLPGARNTLGPKHGDLIEGIARFIHNCHPVDLATTNETGKVQKQYRDIKGAS